MHREPCVYPYSSGLLHWNWDNLTNIPLQWRHNEHPGDCWSIVQTNISKIASKPALLALFEGNPLVNDGLSKQRASNTKAVSIWWRHHNPVAITSSPCIIIYFWPISHIHNLKVYVSWWQFLAVLFWYHLFHSISFTYTHLKTNPIHFCHDQISSETFMIKNILTFLLLSSPSAMTIDSRFSG